MISRRDRRSGFTLIEILVVLFIVSIMSGIVVANLPSFTQTREFEAEAKRVRVLLELARDEAIIQAREYGFKPEHDRYEFYAYDELEQVWELIHRRPFHPHTMPANTTLMLNVEGERFQLTEDDGPPILILSSGEITTFELIIDAGDGTSKTLVSDGFTKLKWRDAMQDKETVDG